MITFQMSSPSEVALLALQDTTLVAVVVLCLTVGWAIGQQVVRRLQSEGHCTSKCALSEPSQLQLEGVSKAAQYEGIAPGRALLEQYAVFGAKPGSWILGPLTSDDGYDFDDDASSSNDDESLLSGEAN
mmetsp:Transcript_30834/g.70740  ORF Transcript_30834/g.70740 Transcript_30834/m.70740 type:complete len:129 (+) Transcript_30834:154-540(+)